MDWLATVRVHPFDQIFTKTCQMIPLCFLGFTPESLGVYVILIDVRSPEEYAEDHIGQSLLVPLTDIQADTDIISN